MLDQGSLPSSGSRDTSVCVRACGKAARAPNTSVAEHRESDERTAATGVLAREVRNFAAQRDCLTAQAGGSRLVLLCIAARTAAWSSALHIQETARPWCAYIAAAAPRFSGNFKYVSTERGESSDESAT